MKMAEAQTAEPTEKLLAQAQERIEQHRKGEVSLTLRRADGQPLAGATVTLEQTRHEFLFGCNLFRWGRISDPAQEEAYRERFAALLNYATLPFYWRMYEPQQGQPRYEYTERVVEWCQQQGITCKGHPLTWDHPAGDPAWLPDEGERIQQLSTARVREIVSRFAGRINLWDVVNEPTDLSRFPTKMNRFARSLGAVAYTALHLRTARQANPQAKLLVNDYRTDPAFYNILNALREDGKLLFDAVGLQSHMHGGIWPLGRIWEVCQRFAGLGLPLHFTETTLVSGPRVGRRWGATTPEGEEKQAQAVEQFYTLVFAHPAVEALTWWDFSDEGAWKGAPAGWLRRDMSPKPAYERLRELIKGEWWTKTKGQTDAQGTFTARAVFGHYRVTVRTPDGREETREFVAQRGGENRWEWNLGV